MDLITSPATVGYSPPSTSVVHNAHVSLTDRSPASVVHLVQYDDTLPIVAVALKANNLPYTVPSGAAVNVRMKKPDGTYVYNPALGVSEDGQTAYIAITVQMTAVAGKIAPVIEIVVDGNVAATGTFTVIIDENPVPESAIESTDEFLTIQQLAAQVQAAAKVVSDNEAAIQAVADNVDAIQQAPTAAANAAASATFSESWAVGGTGTREGENTNNAKYWCNQAQTVAQGALGWYESESALQAAHPTGQNGQWAIVGTTDTIWTWDSDTGAWINSGNQTDLSDYYTKEQADAAFATAAQGQLAQSAVQSINGKTGSAVTLSSTDVGALSSVFAMPSIISAFAGGGILDKEKQKVSLLNVDVSTSLAEQNKPYFFGSDTNSDISNTPYTSGPFYGFRFVIQSFGTSPTPHLTTVIVIESYPVAGRVWGNTYDSTTSNWYGWRQNGAQEATLFYDEMAAAYNEGVASVGQ